MADNPGPWNILMAYLGIPQLAMPPGPRAQTGLGATQVPPGWGGGPAGSAYRPYSLPVPVTTEPVPAPGAAMMPTDQELGFDPNGPGQWHTAIMHPFDTIRADLLAGKAIDETKRLYPNDPGQLQNDAADAFRHAYWSYLMTKALGPDRAKQVGDEHEISYPDPDGERAMDLYNNGVGRNLAQQGGGSDATAAIQRAIKNGSLRLKPY